MTVSNKSAVAILMFTNYTLSLIAAMKMGMAGYWNLFIILFILSMVFALLASLAVLNTTLSPSPK